MALSTVRRLLKVQRAQLQGLVEFRGVKRLRPIYEQSRAELEARLADLVKRGQGKSFSAQHVRVVLAQVYQTISDLQGRMGEHLDKQQRIGTALAQRHVITAAKTLERTFTGHTPSLQIEQVAILRGIDKRVTPSLLNRYKKSVQLYGKPVIKKIRDQMALSLVQGEGVDEAVDRVAGVDGIFAGERWRAERIVRCELAYGYGAVQQKTHETLRQEMPDLMKRLVATHDLRTGADSLILDGQTVPVDQPFTWRTRVHGADEIVRYMHPP